MTAKLTLNGLARLAKTCSGAELAETILARLEECAALFHVSSDKLASGVTLAPEDKLCARVLVEIATAKELNKTMTAEGRDRCADLAAASCVTEVLDGAVRVNVEALGALAKGVDLVAFADSAGVEVLFDARKVLELCRLDRELDVTVDCNGLHARWSATGGLDFYPVVRSLARPTPGAKKVMCWGGGYGHYSDPTSRVVKVVAAATELVTKEAA